MELDPHEGLEFDSEQSAKSFYNSYARRTGFSTRVGKSRRSQKNDAIIQRTFLCAKEGFRSTNEHRSKTKTKHPRAATRVGCKAMISIKLNEINSKWKINRVIREHNHELVDPNQVHSLRSHRQIYGAARALIDTLHASGMRPRRIMSELVKVYGDVSKLGFTETDLRSYIRNIKVKNLENDYRVVIDYLRRIKEDFPSFYYESDYFGNLFWTDEKSRNDYGFFRDSVRIDTAFRGNRYRLPFVPVTGVNNHGETVLFGCAFLVNETEESFVSLFNMFLDAMSGRLPPVSITTDYDETIRLAVMRVFPETRHRFCKWHMFKKCRENLSHVMLENDKFESDFRRCVDMVESVDEFETCWVSFLDRYGLRDDEWLQSVYRARREVVPVYLRDTFFGEMSSAHCSDSMNSYFDGYVNASTGFSQFFSLYEKALESRNEKEVKADFETMNTPPILRTPSPMEKQVSLLYTRNIFSRFQDELVGTLTFMAKKMEEDGEVFVYQVTKYGEDNTVFRVRFNVLEMRATCSCKMFEFSGLLCRHILTVFRVTNILILPSHYILKRWTRNAKSSVILDGESKCVVPSYLESHTVRLCKLRHEALKFVDEGVSSSETYDIAMVALQEASEKVAQAFKCGGKTSLLNTHVNNSTIDEDEGSLSVARKDECVNSSELESEDFMDKKIRELNEELESANKKCEAYRGHLLSALKDIEDHEKQSATKVLSIKLSLKDATA